LDFEIAVRDIAPGEELTDDYGTLNLDEPFQCPCRAPRCRGQVMPDDPLRHAAEWDRLIADAFPEIARVEQPLWDLVEEKTALKQVLPGRVEASFRANSLPRCGRPISLAWQDTACNTRIAEVIQQARSGAQEIRPEI
jgi:hypothetical protein